MFVPLFLCHDIHVSISNELQYFHVREGRTGGPPLKNNKNIGFIIGSGSTEKSQTYECIMIHGIAIVTEFVSLCVCIYVLSMCCFKNNICLNQFLNGHFSNLLFLTKR